MSKVGVYEPQSVEQDSVKSLSLNESESGETSSKKRIPKRVLHFCDGTIEEYSSDDESDHCEPQTERQLMATNMDGLPWMPWFWYHTVFFGSKALAVCDYVGESLANAFGIISPKYEYEIEHYKRVIAEEEERRKQDIELGGWSENTAATDNTTPVQSEPQSQLHSTPL